MKNKIITPIIIIIGIIFFVFPMIMDSYNHYLQNDVYNKTHERVVSCRAKIALLDIDKGNYVTEKKLDRTCGTFPNFDTFEPENVNGVLSLYSWIGQKVNFIPI